MGLNGLNNFAITGCKINLTLKGMIVNASVLPLYSHTVMNTLETQVVSSLHHSLISVT